MNSRVTLSRVIGLVFLVAALVSGPASAATGETPQGLKADGLRYQAMARFYADRPAASFYTARALRADGLRWQAQARFYAAQSPVARSSADGFDWGSAVIGGAGTIVVLLGAGGLAFGVRKLRQERLAV
jgi:hypothetical protein